MKSSISKPNRWYELDIFNEVDQSITDSFPAFAGTDSPLRCRTCGKWDEPAVMQKGCPLALKYKKDKYDLFFTGDGYLIVAVELLEKLLAAKARFKWFPVSTPGQRKYRLVLPVDRVPIPPKIRKYKYMENIRPSDYLRAFGDPCKTCHRYLETSIGLTWFPVPRNAKFVGMVVEGKRYAKYMWFVDEEIKALFESLKTRKLKFMPIEIEPPKKMTK